MREIKFRAWIKKESKYDYFPQVPEFTKSWGYVKSEYVLEQYTGLKDKNGVEIYEGDIIRHKHTPSHLSVVKWISEDDEWDYTGWMIESSYSVGGAREVIGNIHENPELLKQ